MSSAARGRAGAEPGLASQHFRDDIAGLDDANGVADPDVFPRDLLAMCSVAPRHGDALDPHPPEDGDGRKDAGPGHPDHDVVDKRLRRAGRQLEGERPAGLASGRRQPAARVRIVELHDDPVDLVLEPVATLLHLSPVGRGGVTEVGEGLLGAELLDPAGGGGHGGRGEREDGLLIAGQPRSPPRRPCTPGSSQRDRERHGSGGSPLPRRSGTGRTRCRA